MLLFFVPGILRSVLFALLLLWLSGCQTPAQPSSANLMWEARKGSQQLTLVGTMHRGIRSQDLPPLLWQRLEAADKLIIEADLEAMDPQLARRYWELPPGQNLEQLLGPEDWQELRAVLGRSFPTLSEQQLRRMTPVAASAQIMLGEALTEAPASEVPMDTAICRQATAQQKSCVYLETLDEQLGYLKQVFTIDELRGLLRKDTSEDFRDLLAAYREGRSDLIESMIEDMPPTMRLVLLDQRNERWMQRLGALLSPRHTMLAVGAAHFGGEKSLLRLLAAEGYSIKALPASEGE